MDDSERRKMVQLIKEKKEGKDKMDWMYKQDKPEAEDYLLGKRIDKHIEEAVEKVKDDDIALFNERIKANINMDMQAKQREDPLFAIRRKEDEVKRRILENPVKMKQLKKNLEKQKKVKERKRKKSAEGFDSEDDLMKKYLNILQKKQTGSSTEKSGRRKHKKRKHRDDSDQDSDHDQRGWRNYDNDDKYARKHGKSHKHRNDSDEEKASSKSRHSDKRSRSDSSKYKHHSDRDFKRRDDLDRRKDYGYRDDRKSDSHASDLRRKCRHDSDSDNDGSPDRRRSEKQSSSRSDTSGKNDRYKKRSGNSPRHRHDTSDSDSDNGRGYSGHIQIKQESSSSSDSESDDGSAQQTNVKKYGLIKLRADDHSSNSRKEERRRSRSPKRSRSPVPVKSLRAKTPPRRAEKPRKLTEEEKQKKLEEMMDNAKWRDEQRKKNVKHYAEQDRKEEMELKSRNEADFLNPLMSGHAEKSSVEDRIKRNKYNIQRTNTDIDRFLKK